jgi:Family of unknown function (DUF5995)
VDRLDDLVHALQDTIDRAKRGDLPRDYGVFAVTSQRFVLELMSHLDDGGFHEPDWVRTLLLDADRRYLDALNGVNRPGPWKVAFDHADLGFGKVIRNLLLGINAHLFYDLVLTLNDHLGGPPTPAQRADFERINALIGEAVDSVQNMIVAGHERWLYNADVTVGRLDELVVWTLFARARRSVFDDGAALLAGTITLAAVEARATRYARLLRYMPL